MAVTTADIKKLREETGAGVMDVKKALDEAKGDFSKAKELIKKRGLAKAAKKADRETKEGFVGVYQHTTGKVAAMVSLLCETDFVARNEEFTTLAREIAMQVASMQPKSVDDLLQQDYIRDASVTVDELVKQLAGKLGENVQVGEFFIIKI